MGEVLPTYFIRSERATFSSSPPSCHITSMYHFQDVFTKAALSFIMYFLWNTDKSFYLPLSGSRKPEVGVFIRSDETEHHIDLDKTPPLSQKRQWWHPLPIKLRSSEPNQKSKSQIQISRTKTKPLSQKTQWWDPRPIKIRTKAKSKIIHRLKFEELKQTKISVTKVATPFLDQVRVIIIIPIMRVVITIIVIIFRLMILMKMAM